MIMRFLSHVFNKFIRWFKPTDQKLKIINLDESPSYYTDNTLYLVGDSSVYFVELKCPCGCGDLIQLKTFGSKPSWEIAINQEGGATLAPSVWRTKGCKAHFFIRDSKVIWVSS